MILKNLKNLLVENDSDVLAQDRREIKNNTAFLEMKDKYDGEAVTIFVNGGAVIATIGFNKSNYVVLKDLTIDDNPDENEFDLSTIKEKAEKVLNTLAYDDGDLTDEIDLER